MPIDIKNLGEAAAQALRSKAAEKIQPQTYARHYIDIVTTAHPAVKLPAIMSLEQTKMLMEAAAVTRSHLREALAAARKDIKQQVVDADLKPAGRPRLTKATGPADRGLTKAKPEPAKINPLAGLFDDPLVPN